MLFWGTNFLPTNLRNFFLSSSPPHKNLLCNLHKILTTPSGVLKKDMKKREREDITKLIRQILPTKDKCSCFYVTSLFFTLDIIGS